MTEGEGRVVAGRYRLVGPIGRGGMGVVWRARDQYLHRDVAIKELKLRESAEQDAAVRRMLREARAAAQLRHPGIVTVHDVVIEDDLPWIVMELIDGRSLADILERDGPLPIDQAAQIGIQILRALDAAHQRGVFHRDVKPGNIMLDGDRVVLTDFGIAMIDGASALTSAGQMPGSPEFIAPERIDGHEATPAADMWAVGITLYAAVVGYTPFKRKDVPTTLAAAASREPDPDRRIGRLWPVIQGLLRKQPAERMEAKDAIERLTTIAGALAPRNGSASSSPPSEAETWIDNPSDQITVVGETTPNTRTAPPLMPVFPPPSAAPGDVTLDPFTPQPPDKSNRGILLVLAAVLVVALVVVVVAVVTSKSPPGAQKQNQPTTTPVAPPLPRMKTYREQLGFSLDVPQEWARTASQTGEQSDVVWQDTNRTVRSGPLLVQVVRDDTKAGTSARAYVTARGSAHERGRDILEYKQLSITGDDVRAELEYVYRFGSGGAVFRVLTRAVTSKGKLYALTFSMYADDPRILQDQWQASRPVITAIGDSFKIVA